MKLISTIRYWKSILLSNHFVYIVPLVTFIGIIISKPWEQDNLYQLSCQVYSWEYITLGPLIGLILLLFCCLEKIDRENTLFCIGSRKKVAQKLLQINGICSLAISGYLNLGLFLIGKIFYNFKFAGKEIMKIYHINIFQVSIRTFFSMCLLLNILGIFFMITQLYFGKISYGIICMLIVVAAEAAGKFYIGKQLFWEYAFPIDTVLHLSKETFRNGMIYLVLFSFIMSCILFLVVETKDYLVRKEEKL